MSWGSEAVTAAGGEYRLCWCAGGFNCWSSADYLAEVGTIHVDGPTTYRDYRQVTMTQTRTCISGQTCAFDGIYGFYPSLDDVVLIMDTCGTRALADLSTSVAAPDMSTGASWLGYGDDFNAMPQAGYVVSVTGSGASVSWGTAAMTARGGQYRLCWCKSAAWAWWGCNRAEHFRTTIGELTLIGPKASGSRGRALAHPH